MKFNIKLFISLFSLIFIAGCAAGKPFVRYEFEQLVINKTRVQKPFTNDTTERPYVAPTPNFGPGSD